MKKKKEEEGIIDFRFLRNEKNNLTYIFFFTYIYTHVLFPLSYIRKKDILQINGDYK